jgi:hypothetical protein
VSAAALAVPRLAARGWRWGRAFIHPAFDLAVIGGGLSFALVAWLLVYGTRGPSLATMWVLALMINSAHFAASTVRLYTKPGAVREMPFVTLALPLVMVALATLGLVFPAGFGRHLVALYFTWSPYHYAAQAFGLALIYCYRSGVTVTPGGKRLLRLACLVPFAYAFLDARGAGIEWFVPASVLAQPWALTARVALLGVLRLASYALPAALVVAGGFGRGPAIPVISAAIMLANAVWWTTLRYLDAFVWATIFHGLQYLAVVIIFHVRERSAGSGAGSGWRAAAAFYAVCVVSGYLLFQVWPHAYTLAGFSFAESFLVIVAIINIHHFVVDAFIWRLRRDRNYAVVTSAGTAPAASASPIPAPAA